MVVSGFYSASCSASSVSLSFSSFRRRTSRPLKSAPEGSLWVSTGYRDAPCILVMSRRV
ncbi:MAG: hypothetical protein F4Y49_09320 [Dehalococcoidia bacterium]|nr:hypothetical protein [Dehalococcoidia bacterium]